MTLTGPLNKMAALVCGKMLGKMLGGMLGKMLGKMLRFLGAQTSSSRLLGKMLGIEEMSKCSSKLLGKALGVEEMSQCVEQDLCDPWLLGRRRWTRTSPEDSGDRHDEPNPPGHWVRVLNSCDKIAAAMVCYFALMLYIPSCAVGVFRLFAV